ncbi:MAG: 30S ribosomal protein S6 [Patescibacteria group bacterium]|nr:30S ribosomal protein S6 [Patescibacteria group bacterium]
MRNYQLVLVLKASLSEVQKKKLLATIKTWLKDVKIAKEEEWGQKPLSYSVKKEAAGFYLNYQLEVKDTFPLDFEKKLMTNEDVLRHLLLRQK